MLVAQLPLDRVDLRFPLDFIRCSWTFVDHVPEQQSESDRFDATGNKAVRLFQKATGHRTLLHAEALLRFADRVHSPVQLIGNAAGLRVAGLNVG